MRDAARRTGPPRCVTPPRSPHAPRRIHRSRAVREPSSPAEAASAWWCKRAWRRCRRCVAGGASAAGRASGSRSGAGGRLASPCGLTLHVASLRSRTRAVIHNAPPTCVMHTWLLTLVRFSFIPLLFRLSAPGPAQAPVPIPNDPGSSDTSPGRSLLSWKGKDDIKICQRSFWFLSWNGFKNLKTVIRVSWALRKKSPW